MYKNVENFNRSIVVRLSESDKEFIATIAAIRSISISELVRRVVMEKLLQPTQELVIQTD